MSKNNDHDSADQNGTQRQRRGPRTPEDEPTDPHDTPSSSSSSVSSEACVRRPRRGPKTPPLPPEEQQMEYNQAYYAEYGYGQQHPYAYPPHPYATPYAQPYVMPTTSDGSLPPPPPPPTVGGYYSTYYQTPGAGYYQQPPYVLAPTTPAVPIRSAALTPPPQPPRLDTAVPPPPPKPAEMVASSRMKTKVWGHKESAAEAAAAAAAAAGLPPLPPVATLSHPGFPVATISPVIITRPLRVPSSGSDEGNYALSSAQNTPKGRASLIAPSDILSDAHQTTVKHKRKENGKNASPNGGKMYEALPPPPLPPGALRDVSPPKNQNASFTDVFTPKTPRTPGSALNGPHRFYSTEQSPDHVVPKRSEPGPVGKEENIPLAKIKEQREEDQKNWKRETRTPKESDSKQGRSKDLENNVEDRDENTKMHEGNEVQKEKVPETPQIRALPFEFFTVGQTASATPNTPVPTKTTVQPPTTTPRASEPLPKKINDPKRDSTKVPTLFSSSQQPGSVSSESAQQKSHTFSSPSSSVPEPHKNSKLLAKIPPTTGPSTREDGKHESRDRRHDIKNGYDKNCSKQINGGLKSRMEFFKQQKAQQMKNSGASDPVTIPAVTKSTEIVETNTEKARKENAETKGMKHNDGYMNGDRKEHYRSRDDRKQNGTSSSSSLKHQDHDHPSRSEKSHNDHSASKKKVNEHVHDEKQSRDHSDRVQKESNGNKDRKNKDLDDNGQEPKMHSRSEQNREDELNTQRKKKEEKIAFSTELQEEHYKGHPKSPVNISVPIVPASMMDESIEEVKKESIVSKPIPSTKSNAVEEPIHEELEISLETSPPDQSQNNAQSMEVEDVEVQNVDVVMPAEKCEGQVQHPVVAEAVTITQDEPVEDNQDFDARFKTSENHETVHDQDHMDISAPASSAEIDVTTVPRSEPVENLTPKSSPMEELTPATSPMNMPAMFEEPETESVTGPVSNEPIEMEQFSSPVFSLPEEEASVKSEEVVNNAAFNELECEGIPLRCAEEKSSRETNRLQSIAVAPRNDLTTEEESLSSAAIDATIAEVASASNQYFIPPSAPNRKRRADAPEVVTHNNHNNIEAFVSKISQEHNDNLPGPSKRGRKRGPVAAKKPAVVTKAALKQLPPPAKKTLKAKTGREKEEPEDSRSPSPPDDLELEKSSASYGKSRMKSPLTPRNIRGGPVLPEPHQLKREIIITKTEGPNLTSEKEYKQENRQRPTIFTPPNYVPSNKSALNTSRLQTPASSRPGSRNPSIVSNTSASSLVRKYCLAAMQRDEADDEMMGMGSGPNGGTLAGLLYPNERRTKAEESAQSKMNGNLQHRAHFNQEERNIRLCSMADRAGTFGKQAYSAATNVKREESIRLAGHKPVNLDIHGFRKPTVEMTPAMKLSVKTLKKLTKQYNLPKLSRRFRDYVRVKTDPSGGGHMLSCDYLELKEKLTEKDITLFCRQFLRLAMAESKKCPIFCVGIMENGAHGMENCMRLLVASEPTLAVKVGHISNKQDCKTMALKTYYENAIKSYLHGTFRYGPMHAVTLTGKKAEEVGKLCTPILKQMMLHPLLSPVLPWGDFTEMYGVPIPESNDGPILWMRPGEQTVPSTNMKEDATIPVGKRGAIRETEFLDRTNAHADILGHDDTNSALRTAAIGVLQCIPGTDIEQLSPEERPTVKEVVAFTGDSMDTVFSHLNMDFYNFPTKQCQYWVEDSKLNTMRRANIKYAKFDLRVNDMYFLPRHIVHQFRTLRACISIAWHARLLHQFKHMHLNTVDDPENECCTDYSDDEELRTKR